MKPADVLELSEKSEYTDIIIRTAGFVKRFFNNCLEMAHCHSRGNGNLGGGNGLWHAPE
jgi:hypothetical protein